MLGGAAFFIIALGLQRAADIINPFLLALVFALSVAPLLNWLVRKGVPSWLSLVITLAILIIAGFAFLTIMFVSVNRLAETIPAYSEDLSGQISAFEEWLAGLGIDTQNFSSLDIFSPEKVLGLIGDLTKGLVGAIANAGFMLMILIFMILEANGFSTKFRKQSLSGHPFLDRCATLGKDVRRYVVITTQINFMVGLVDTILLIIIGVPLPILWGILSWLLGYIPSIGFWLALIPPVFLAFITIGWEAALIVFIGYVLINGSVQNFLSPRLMGKGLNISALVVVLSLFFWSWILGIVGGLLSSLLTIGVIRLILESSEDTMWLANLLSAGGGENGKDDSVSSGESQEDAVPTSA
ncbi:MAG TPA: AI-2E family transporter [candidate division Zixibacteria bacterium]|nr:AI-2E family transporter [candidate division Zixibacteria bacterium]